MKADGGGALIYIVLAVISLIVSAVAKNNKKEVSPGTSRPSSSEPTAPQQPQQTTWQKELEDIFGKVLTEPEVVVEKQEYQEPRPMVKKEVKIEKSFVTQSKSNENSENISAFNDEQLKTDVSSVYHHEDEEHELAGVNLDEFELNKAVIYSEVLNRKYF